MHVNAYCLQKWVDLPSFIFQTEFKALRNEQLYIWGKFPSLRKFLGTLMCILFRSKIGSRFVRSRPVIDMAILEF